MLLRWLDSLEGWRGDRKTGKRMGKGGMRREIRRGKGGKKEGDKRTKRTKHNIHSTHNEKRKKKYYNLFL